MNAIKKNKEALLQASREVGLEVNVEKKKYMVASHQNIGQNYNLLIANKFSENVAQFKHFGTTLTNQNYICKEIKSTLIIENACYRTLQNVSSCLLFITIKTKI
jgi:hypothetical protein